jgi:LuxR family maltose regulon positive regulatory protein
MGDVERFARLIAGNAVYLIYIGELHTIERWLQALPDETLCSSPWLYIAHAWINAYLGEHDMVNSLLDNTKQILADPGKDGQLDEQQKSEIYAYISLIQGLCDYFTGDLEQSTARLRAALENIPKRDNVICCYTTGLLGTILRVKGALDEGELLIEESVRLSHETGFEELEADAITHLMSLRLSQGRFRDAAEAGFDALTLDKVYFDQFGKHLFTVGRVHYYLGEIFLNWNELDTALEHNEIGLMLAQKWGKADEIAAFYSGLSRILFAQGDSEGALNAIRQAKRIARKISPQWKILSDLAEARLQLCLGNLDAAVCLSQGFEFQSDRPISFVELSEYLIFTRLLAAQEKHAEASALLDQLKAVAESAGASGDLIPILVTQAMVFQEVGQSKQALKSISAALALAEPEKSIRIFLDEGERMAELLRCLAPGHDSYPFAMQLLASIRSETEGQPAPGLLEPLSERELDVLNLLTTPVTHAEIAKQLYISRNTVRSHVKHIYSKLNVNNRIQAIEKARDLSLLA